jgi:hypothetical protein
VWEFTIWNQRLETSPQLYVFSPPTPSSSPRHISLLSYLCDRSHCFVSSWHGSPSIDEDSLSRHCIRCHNDRYLCLRWSDRCFVCPLSLPRHSTRGSSCPLALCFFHSPSPFLLLLLLLFMVDQRDEHVTEHRKDREISAANAAVTGFRLCLLQNDLPTGLIDFSRLSPHQLCQRDLILLWILLLHQLMIPQSNVLMTNLQFLHPNLFARSHQWIPQRLKIPQMNQLLPQPQKRWFKLLSFLSLVSVDFLWSHLPQLQLLSKNFKQHLPPLLPLMRLVASDLLSFKSLRIL